MFRQVRASMLNSRDDKLHKKCFLRHDGLNMKIFINARLCVQLKIRGEMFEAIRSKGCR